MPKKRFQPEETVATRRGGDCHPIWISGTGHLASEYGIWGVRWGLDGPSESPILPEIPG